MAIAEFIAGLRKRPVELTTSEPKLLQSDLRQRVLDFQEKARESLKKVPLLSDAAKLAKDREGQQSVNFGINTYKAVVDGKEEIGFGGEKSVTIVNSDRFDGLTLGIFIEGAIVDGEERSYRALTNYLRGDKESSAYFAEFHKVRGELKPLRQSDGTASALNGAYEVLKRALEMAAEGAKKSS